MDEWDGWVGGIKSGFIYCLQQSTTILFSYHSSNSCNSMIFFTILLWQQWESWLAKNVLTETTRGFYSRIYLPRLKILQMAEKLKMWNDKIELKKVEKIILSEMGRCKIVKLRNGWEAA
jgi:hypothetical protein